MTTLGPNHSVTTPPTTGASPSQSSTPILTTGPAANQDTRSPSPAAATTPALQPGGVPTGPGSRTAASAPSTALAARAGRAAVADLELLAKFPTAESLPPSIRVDPKDNPAAFLIGGKTHVATIGAKLVESKIGLRVGNELRPVSLGHEPQCSAADAQAAARAAYDAFAFGRGPWPKMTAAERIAAVEKFVTALESKKGRLATLLMWEIGKPQKDAIAEIDRTVDGVRGSIAEWRKMLGEDAKPEKNGTAGNVRREHVPIGPVVFAPPYNYPLNELLTVLLPALLPGNTTVVKTPRFGSLAVQALIPDFAACFPPGVVNMLSGDGRTIFPALMGESWVDDQGQGRGVIAKLMFIGGDKAANAIVKGSPTPGFLQPTLHTGSKNPAVVLPGADLDFAVAELRKGSLNFNGQRCTAEKIIFVPRAEADAFAKKFAAAVDKLVPGMPWDTNVGVTPLPEDGKSAAMQALIGDAKDKGAQVVNAEGGEAYGPLMRPAVLYPCRRDMAICKEEQFGPVVPIVPYDSLAEVYAWMTTSGFGQQVSLWGDPAVAQSVVDEAKLLVQTVNLNQICKRHDDLPFGGRLHSGLVSYRDTLESMSRTVIIAQK